MGPPEAEPADHDQERQRLGTTACAPFSARPRRAASALSALSAIVAAARPAPAHDVHGFSRGLLETLLTCIIALRKMRVGDEEIAPKGKVDLFRHHEKSAQTPVRNRSGSRFRMRHGAAARQMPGPGANTEPRPTGRPGSPEANALQTATCSWTRSRAHTTGKDGPFGKWDSRAE